MSSREFDEFVRAVQELDLEDRAVSATSHTSAVSVKDWESIQENMAKDRES